MLGPESLVVADFVHPVLIPGSLCVAFDFSGVRINEGLPSIILIRVVVFRILQTTDGLAEVSGGIGGSSLIVQGSVLCITDRVAESLVGELHIVRHSHKVVAWKCTGGDSEIALVVDVHPVCVAFLSGDDNHAICTPRSVESTCRSIFKDSHCLDVGRVDGTDSSVIRNTIYNIKR